MLAWAPDWLLRRRFTRWLPFYVGAIQYGALHRWYWQNCRAPSNPGIIGSAAEVQRGILGRGLALSKVLVQLGRGKRERLRRSLHAWCDEPRMRKVAKRAGIISKLTFGFASPNVEIGAETVFDCRQLRIRALTPDDVTALFDSMCGAGFAGTCRSFLQALGESPGR